ncbi:MAG UNVERIFIED_CONTAM: hypothetical protein LVT10_13210 [Anaerolineae bacterium]|jgi:GNAT superfamily N-acetyltransferase
MARASALSLQGVGTALLKWAEARAQALYADLHTLRPLVLRIDFTTGGEEVIELCENNGYQLAFAEDYFAYDLTQPLPAPHPTRRPHPAGV